MEARTAALVIIGDEILKGQVQDTNSNFMCKRLYNLGVKVKKICAVEDSVGEIAKVVSEFSRDYSLVITSGGIGPTHDDVTFKGIALAFNEDVYLNNDLCTFWAQFYSVNFKHNAEALSCIPKSSKIVWAHTNCEEYGKFPVINVQNVYIFAGIPTLLERSFKAIEHTCFTNIHCTFRTSKIYLKVDEGYIVDALNKTVDKFKGSVNFGSYPKTHHPQFKIEITLESVSSKHSLIAAEEYFKTLVDPKWLVYPSEMYERIQQLVSTTANRKFANLLQNSLKIIEKSLKKYPPGSCFVTFNGGKDCTALIHLISAVWAHHGVDSQLSAVYFSIKDPFPEVNDFIKEFVQRYNLDFISVPAPIKPSLKNVLLERPNWKAVFLGTRRSDPNCQDLEEFQMTDADWPQIMRVNPILEWCHSDVWTFLRELSVPYCSLYDNGFTSLGNRGNTKPNPLLRYEDDSGEVKYKPAYTLATDAKERDGRF